MSILCNIFGHKPHPAGWWGDVPYMKIVHCGRDNLDTSHAAAYHECDRCGEDYLVGRLHTNTDGFKQACSDSPYGSLKSWQERQRKEKKE